MSRHLGGLSGDAYCRRPWQSRTNRSLRALAGRNFRLYFTGQIVSTIGTWMQLLAQSWLVLQLTHSGVALGLNVTLQTLPLLVFGVWAGGIADRVDNRKLLIVTAVLGMGQALGLGVLVATGSVTTGWVYAFSFLFGLVFAFDRPAANALLFELVGPADLPSAVGLNSVIQSAGRLVGPAIGGVVIATRGDLGVLLRQCRVVPRGHRRARAAAEAGDVRAHPPRGPARSPARGIALRPRTPRPPRRPDRDGASSGSSRTTSWSSSRRW